MSNRTIRKQEFLEWQRQFDEERRYEFLSLGNAGRRYTDEQKNMAFEMIHEKGIRATSRILCLPRRTLQRWCRAQGVYVPRCPAWVYDWAERRRKRREFWARLGY
jgi:hypothetical protein